MRPRPPARGRAAFIGTAVIIAGLAATLAALVIPLWSYADRPGTETATTLADPSVPTPYGPLSGPDRDLVAEVRLAGLWEVPAGEQAQLKGTTDAVRAAGRQLVAGHTVLDEQVRDTAAGLRLALPDAPTAAQQDLLDELRTARGIGFDRAFVESLRPAQGRLLELSAQVRAGTGNSLVRALADATVTSELDHIKMLEATGFVDYDALAGDPASASSAPSADRSAVPGPLPDPPPAVPVTPTAVPAESPAPSYPLPPAVTGPPPDTGPPPTASTPQATASPTGPAGAPGPA
ncbi:DUF4142 domain-containing protein [Streptomyces actuosus]|uniref:DUF4142 domain-containing protein n=1 Tax=Streptomyces actuosus TaxID=1885 RepID=A0ABS2VUP2_STRAS|nr:DUF4142 domain-containing protein [Streptomyces actuosus]MBN0046854.1 DUF4142 domain-containing protein [Streptomyces actuosus]